MTAERNLKPSLPLMLGVALAFILGAIPRLYFLSSHGSWDTDYRKAWAVESVKSGITQVYGPKESVPKGEFFDQLTGRKPRYEVTFRDRQFVIDYPPLAIAVWEESWRFFTSKPRPYRGDEAENVAIKFPAVLGDLMACIALLWAFRGDPQKAAILASAYWIFPITWVSSAALGNFDGFVPPFLLVSLLLASGSPLLAGATFGVACLIKPTAVVALPVLFLAAEQKTWPRIIAGGVLVTGLVFTPYLLAGTLEVATIHIARLFSQDRLSGGYANPWWLVGHAVSVFREKAEWTDPVDYIRLDAVDFPSGLVGFAIAGLCAAWILYQARHVKKPQSSVYASALLLLVWGALTIGVHDNHNHPLFLLLVATGLATPFLRWLTFVSATSTLLGSVCLHGLGRFYGPQWRAVLPLSDSLARMRMAGGFDLTIVLSIVNTVLLVIALVRLKRTLAELESPVA